MRWFRTGADGRVRLWAILAITARFMALWCTIELARVLGRDSARLAQLRPQREALEHAVLLYHFQQLDRRSKRRARRAVRKAIRKYPWTAGMYASIAAPRGVGNDGQYAYDLATRTWFGTFIGTVQAVGRGWYDVTATQFLGGAQGDGITDDTPSITAAIAFAPAGSVIYIPPVAGANFYLVTKFTVLKPLTILGGGWGQTGQTRRFGQASELIAATTTVFSSSRLKVKAGTTGYMWNIGQHDPGGTANPYLGYDGAMEGFFMRDLVLDGNARTVDVGALVLNTLEHGKIERVRIEHFCRQAINCQEYVREYEFNGLRIWFCGNTTDGQGPAPAYYPTLDLLDNSNGADLHNLLRFSGITIVFSMGDAVRIDTTATVTGSQVRDLVFADSEIHGPVAGVSGFPYVFSVLQQRTTTFMVKSSTDVRLINVNIISTGTADPGATGANGFMQVVTGLSGVAPTIICVTGCTFVGRYTFANAPRYGIWLRNGDLRLETTHVDGGDTANARVEAGATLYYGLLNVTPNGVSFGGAGRALQTIPMQIIWAAQQEISYPGATVAFRLTNQDTPRTIALNMASVADGNVPTLSGGMYLYDITRGARLFYLDGPTGKWHFDGDFEVGAHLLASAAGVPATANLGANVTSATIAAPSNDVRGRCDIVMAGALAANTRICRVNFAAAFAGAVAPGLIMLVCETQGAGIAIVNFYSTGETTGGFDLFADQALAAGTYTVRYLVIG